MGSMRAKRKNRAKGSLTATAKYKTLHDTAQSRVRTQFLSAVPHVSSTGSCVVHGLIQGRSVASTVPTRW